MPLFKLKVYDPQGNMKTLRRESPTEDSLLRSLSLEGFVPISVELDNSGKANRAVKQLKLTDQHMFCSMLAAFLKSGLSLTEVLGLLGRQTKDKSLKPIYGDLRESVESGRSLAHSMRTSGVFREFLVGMVESGERSSSLPEILEKASALLQSEVDLRRKIQSALTYPVLMLVVGLCVVAFLITYVVPQLTSIVVEAGKELPLSTRLLLSLSSLFRVGALPALVIGALAATWMKRKGKRISVPLFKDIQAQLTFSLLFSQLSALTRAGVPLVQALEMSAPIDSKKSRIPFIAEEVRKGYRFSQSLEREGSFPEDIVSIVRIGEMGGNLPDCMERVSSNSWEFAQASMQKWSNLAEPIIIVVLGLITGFVVMAVLLPIFSLSEIVG